MTPDTHCIASDAAVTGRLARLREGMCARDLDAVLVSSRENQEYLSGFLGFRDSSLLVNSLGEMLVTRERAVLIPLPCDRPLVEETVRSGFEIRSPSENRVSDLIREESVRRLGIEAGVMPHSKFVSLERALDGVRICDASGLIERLRCRKDGEEMEAIRQAIRIADEAFRHVLATIRPGIRELDIAIELECFLRREGAMRSSFDPIVTSGSRTAFVHAHASERRILPGELLLVDFGAGRRGYYSDLTRTVVLGRPSADQRRIHGVVLEARKRALDAVRPGVRAGDVDRITRESIAAAGYGVYLAHSVGHGVGLSVHEPPWLRERSDEILEEGAVLAVEPGLYIAGWGGVRVEDMVRVGTGGPEVLTRAPRDLAAVPGG